MVQLPLPNVRMEETVIDRFVTRMNMNGLAVANIGSGVVLVTSANDAAKGSRAQTFRMNYPGVSGKASAEDWMAFEVQVLRIARAFGWVK